MKKLIVSLLITSAFLVFGISQALAADLVVGNDTDVRTTTDTYSNFTIIDTNNPADFSGDLKKFDYYASNTNPFHFVVVDESWIVKWVSDVITPESSGVGTFVPGTPVHVENGWNVGLHFVSTGTIPFAYIGEPAHYTPNNYGLPTVNATLNEEGTSGRTYSFIASGYSCEPTGFKRDEIDMTAALINPATLSGDVNATGCNIGVYFDEDGTVDGAKVYGANYYGIVVRKASVDVKNSEVYNIGERPFNGAQHGVGIYYANVEGVTNGDCDNEDGNTSGNIDNNIVRDYQKGGVVISCPSTKVSVTNNKVLGLTPVEFIAQNGIQFGYGASGEAKGNEIVGNYYQGANWTSTGLLLFDVNANEIKRSNNKFRDNQTNLNVTTRQACPHTYGGVYESWGLCTF